MMKKFYIFLAVYFIVAFLNYGYSYNIHLKECEKRWPALYKVEGCFGTGLSAYFESIGWPLYWLGKGSIQLFKE